MLLPFIMSCHIVSKVPGWKELSNVREATRKGVGRFFADICEANQEAERVSSRWLPCQDGMCHLQVSSTNHCPIGETMVVLSKETVEAS